MIFFKECQLTINKLVQESSFPLWIEYMRIHKMNQYHFYPCIAKNPLTKLKQSLIISEEGFVACPALHIVHLPINFYFNSLPPTGQSKSLPFSYPSPSWLPDFFRPFCSHTAHSFPLKLFSYRNSTFQQSYLIFPPTLLTSSQFQLCHLYYPHKRFRNTGLWPRYSLVASSLVLTV